MLEEPKCWTRGCRHYDKFVSTSDEVTDEGYHMCKAFPKGIPHEIVYGNNLHLEIHKFQKNNIIYEKK